MRCSISFSLILIKKKKNTEGQKVQNENSDNEVNDKFSLGRARSHKFKSHC